MSFPQAETLRQAIAGTADFSDIIVGADDVASDRAWTSSIRGLFTPPSIFSGCAYTFASNSARGLQTLTNEQLVVVADADLHNRSDLLNKLNRGLLPPSCTDAAIILAAYEKWGDSCPEFLVGEFSFAVWDQPRRRLFCCRDHMGSRPFFYWTNGVRLAFASDPLFLFSIPGIARELNRAKLAAFAAAGFRTDSYPDDTFFHAVYSLPSATTLTFEQGALRKRCYWEPMNAVVWMPSREEEIFEALREVLFEAVACRVRDKSRVAAYLSGGLDSSALVAVAAKCLERSNRSVLALAAVLPEQSKPQFSDEREFIEEFRQLPNVDLQYVAPETGGPFDGIECPSSFYPGPLRYSRQYLFEAMQDAAVQNSAETILAGMGGEAGATAWANSYYLELASRFKWHTLVAELWKLRNIRHVSPIRFFFGRLRKILTSDRTLAPFFLLAPDFLRAVGEMPGPQFPRYDHRQEQLTGIRTRMNSHAFRRATPESRIPLTFPLLDKRVLEFCLAVPGDLKVRDGYQRYPIRRALDGILPKRIQWRTSKCAFSPDYPRRYAVQLGRAREFVSAISRRDPVRHVVDLDRLRHVVNRNDLPARSLTALVTVPATIYLTCFLRQFVEFQP